MIFFSSATLFLVLVSVFALVASDNCDKKGILLYEEIVCTPVKSENESCPSKYECNYSQVKSGCLFKGRNYGIREDIHEDLTYSACSIGCRCNDFQSIVCAVLDCPEYFGRPIQPGCYNGYSLGKCCSTGQICNSTADSKTCEVDGTTYKLGQKFYPKDTCLTCVCHENFTGQYDDKTCIKQNCNAEIHHASEIRRNCAPAYFKYDSSEVLCCPADFICPDATDEIKIVNEKAKEQSALECVYGERKLVLGEGFSRKINKYGKDRDLKCECVLPPLVTCKEI